MNTEELRIGNYVLNGIGEMFPANIATLQYPCTELGCISPIPLTEDILLKCGEDNEHLMVDKLGFVIFKNGYPYQFVRDDYKHLHSLQNLYHSLRGEELNVEL